MTRIKKTRTGGPLAPRSPVHEGPKPSNALKGKKRGKGKQAGNKQAEAQQTSRAKSSVEQKDKRVGSKKPIALIAKASEVKNLPPKAEKSAPWPPTTEKAQKAALVQLEKDERFMAQVELLEEGGVLPADELEAFEQKLERYDWLIEQLGLDVEEESDDWDDLSEQGKSLKDEWL